MKSMRSGGGLPERREWLVGLAALLILGVALACSARAAPAGLNLALDRPTDHGVFHARVRSAAEPIPMSTIHEWSLHLTGADGRPVSGAVVLVDGGMPEHGHGLPTAPRVEPGAAPGDYVVRGMKFSMTGWWVLKLAVKAPDGRSDTITFNVVL